jgi:hypothetical protein
MTAALFIVNWLAGVLAAVILLIWHRRCTCGGRSGRGPGADASRFTPARDGSSRLIRRHWRPPRSSRASAPTRLSIRPRAATARSRSAARQA